MMLTTMLGATPAVPAAPRVTAMPSIDVSTLAPTATPCTVSGAASPTDFFSVTPVPAPPASTTASAASSANVVLCSWLTAMLAPTPATPAAARVPT